jgi:hypothetical protein
MTMHADEPLDQELGHAVARWRAIPDTDARGMDVRERLRARIASLPVPHAPVHAPVRAPGFPTPRHRAPRGLRWAFAAAIAVILLINVMAITLRRREGSVPLTPDLSAAAVPVVFTLDAGEARRVSVVGDFNGWSERGFALTRSGNRWSGTLPLAAGRYAYTFRVDDRWVADDLAPRAPQDFGPPTSILIVSNGNP